MDGGGGGRWRLRRGGANGGGAKPPDGTLPLAGRGHPGPAPPTGRPALPTSSSVRFLSGHGRPAPSTRRERSAPSSGRLAPVTGRPSPSTDSPAPSTGRPAPSTGGPTPVTGRPAPPPERSAHLAQAPPPLVGRRLPSAEHPRSGTNLRLPPRGRGRPLPAAGHSPSSKPAPGPQHAASRPSHSLRRQGNNTGAPGKGQTRISFGQLQSLAADDGVQILQKLSRPDLLSLFAKLTDEARLEVSWMSLVVKVLAKLACVEYQPLVIRLFCAICKENFLDQLLLRIVQPGALSSGAAQLSAYVDFYQDFTILAHGIVRLLPTLASEKLHNLLQMACLMLTQMPSFDSKARICKELELVCAKLTDGEARLKSREPAARTGREFQFDELDPPDNYRHLSVYPTAEDIVDGEPPYLRRILPRGRYRDADHYLDVLFRLLREDFVRPLREGFAEFCQLKLQAAGGNRSRRLSHIRVYERVWFKEMRSDNEAVGLELVFDIRKLGDVNWEYSRRLVKGILLILSRDMTFSDIILATVSKRDVKQLSSGRVVVELYDSPVTGDLFRGHFLMIECVVFYGSYLHPMRALQALDEASLPLREYLVDASNNRVVPVYLQPGVSFKLPMPEATAPPTVLTDVTRLEEWPSAKTLGLDDSQYLALQGALTNKVMLVQGPPGTGKTFLGLQVARTLLLNENLWRPALEPRPLLVLCSTNHALDQFMMGLLPFTESIVRIGNPCKEPSLEAHDIFHLRHKKMSGAQRLMDMIKLHQKTFFDYKRVHGYLQFCCRRLRQNCGLVHPESLHSFGIITDVERDFFRGLPLEVWLLGAEATSGDQFAQVLWDPQRHLRGMCEGLGDLPPFKRTVSLAVSKQVLEATVAKLVEDEEMAPAIAVLRCSWDTIQARLTSVETQPPEEQPAGWDLAQMSEVERWQQYRFWNKKLLAVFAKLSDDISARYINAALQVHECRMVQDQTIMQNHLVVGMSISYAAMRHRILKQLKPKIVIVEEAAEVLETSLLVSLPASVEHLVMIGDHQQLRPQTSVPDLAKNYNLDISMFERLVNNGVHCVTLHTQHRMRPEVSKLISPHIYPNLLNHESVHHFPDIRGVTKNVFFVDHQHPEEEAKFLKDANTFQNSHEALFISSLARYFLRQGYKPSQITVLCTYKGQLYFFTKQLRLSNPHLRDIRITAVDDYQGEENDIVLLSLVRSNQRSNLGYVGIVNRACVALSRARHGFFMVGNMSTLTSKESVWSAVEAELRRQDAVGESLMLRCDVHGDVTSVSKAKDFDQCPQGGCMRLCGVLLLCSHVCPQICHPDDRQHMEFRCQETCLRPACDQGHPCSRRCYEECPPCMEPKQVELKCGHVATMPCHREPDVHMCQTLIEVVLPACRHAQRAECHQKNNLDILRCVLPCEYRVDDCGHACSRKCHVLDDPHHEQYKCRKPCEDLRDGCGADHKCRRLCHEDCEPCNVEVAKDLPCGHIQRMACKDEPLAELCTQKCRRTMPCDPSHRCGNMCRDPCGPCNVKVDKKLLCNHTQPVPCSVDAVLFQECSQLVEFSGVPACGHTIMVPCSSSYGPSDPELLSLCKEPCLKKLQCEHQCAGTCGQCRQGCFHVACNAKCKRLLMCGHVCEAPCATSCPPCRKACPVKCRHTKCGRTCGERCAPCKEPCPLECPHMKCPSLCGEPCPQDPCSEPCTRVVKKCGHACVGLCGETCVCRECSDIEVFFGTEDEDDARFIILADCNHVFEVTSLDRWILNTTDEDGNNKPITKKVCPRCNTPVDTTLRYSNATKQSAADVAVIKEKLFGTWTAIDPKVKETREILKEVPVPEHLPAHLSALGELRGTLDTLLNKVEKKPRGRKRNARAAPRLSLSNLQSLHQYVNVVRSLHKAYSDALPRLTTSTKAELSGCVELLCREFYRRNLIRLTAQEASDINVELTRFHRLAALCKVEGTLSPDDRDKLTGAIRSVGPYDMSKDGEVRERLENQGNKMLEILAVKAALGLAKGHWFKCPNGHFYVITECGGAMEESICNECRAPIGGTNHRLRSDNNLATELGETTPAWPPALY